LGDLVLDVVLPKASHDLCPARVVIEQIVVPFGALLRESLSQLVAVGALSAQDPALVNHVDSCSLGDQENGVAALTVPRVVAHLALHLGGCNILHIEGTAVAPLNEPLHAGAVGAAPRRFVTLGQVVAHDVATEQANGRLLQLLAANAALARVVLLDETVEVAW